MDLNTEHQEPTNSKGVQPVTTATKDVQSPQRDNSVFLNIKRVTAWVMILSATLFAFIGVLAVWQVLGEDAGDVVWRAFISLVIISFASLVVNVASRVATNK